MSATPARLPFPIPELAGYLVDADGQVWRAGGGDRRGDRRLVPGDFPKMLQSWMPENASKARWECSEVRQLMPGVWQWHELATPALPGGLKGAFALRRSCLAGIHRVPTAERQLYLELSRATRAFDERTIQADDPPRWFAVSGEERGRLLIAGSAAYATIERMGTLGH